MLDGQLKIVKPHPEPENETNTGEDIDVEESHVAMFGTYVVTIFPFFLDHVARYRKLSSKWIPRAKSQWLRFVRWGEADRSAFLCA